MPMITSVYVNISAAVTYCIATPPFEGRISQPLPFLAVFVLSGYRSTVFDNTAFVEFCQQKNPKKHFCVDFLLRLVYNKNRKDAYADRRLRPLSFWLKNNRRVWKPGDYFFVSLSNLNIAKHNSIMQNVRRFVFEAADVLLFPINGYQSFLDSMSSRASFTKSSTDILPLSPSPRLRTETEPSSASLSPTTSM